MLFEGFRRGLVDVGGGIKINHVIGGEGEPVLLLHGFPQNLSMWARVAPTLAQRSTVICADLRGYGDSSKPEMLSDGSNYSFRAMAADQIALMQSFGFETFHVIGHDRGGRTGHRMALDHPHVVRSLSVLDIVPTYSMFMETTKDVAAAYWHWYFLSLPTPFPEQLISANPDFFYNCCLVGWGATRLQDFEPEMLAEYQRCWRDKDMIRGSCCDYRAALIADLAYDKVDLDRKIACPTLALWGSSGLMHQYFDIGQTWYRRASHLVTRTLPGGHFFVDQFPRETSQILSDFLEKAGPATENYC